MLAVSTGTGDFILETAKQCALKNPDIRLTGYDFNGDMLGEAEKKQGSGLAVEALPRINFIKGEVASMPFRDGEFDAMGITFGIRNLVFENPLADRYLAEMNRVLIKGGRLVVLESSRPSNVIWRLFNGIYLRGILPFLGGLVSGNLKAYRYLARSSRRYYTLGEMGEILERAGFKTLRGRSLFLGSVMLLVAEKNIYLQDDPGRNQ